MRPAKVPTYNLSIMRLEFPLALWMTFSCPAPSTTSTLTLQAAHAPAPFLPDNKDVPEPDHPEEGTTFVRVGASGAPMANTNADVMTSPPSQLLIGYRPQPVHDFFSTPPCRTLGSRSSHLVAVFSPAFAALASSRLGNGTKTASASYPRKKAEYKSSVRSAGLQQI